MPVAALIVQDSSGSVEGADSYCAISEVREYFENLGDAVFEGETDDSVTVCTRRAMQFFEVVWGPRAKGTPTAEDQSTTFPRNDEDFPAKLIPCICELAKMAMDGPLGGAGSTAIAPDASRIERMKAGSVEIAFGSRVKSAVETEYADRFFMIEKMAATFLKSNALNTGSSR